MRRFVEPVDLSHLPEEKQMEIIRDDYIKIPVIDRFNFNPSLMTKIFESILKEERIDYVEENDVGLVYDIIDMSEKNRLIVLKAYISALLPLNGDAWYRILDKFSKEEIEEVKEVIKKYDSRLYNLIK